MSEEELLNGSRVLLLEEHLIAEGAAAAGVAAYLQNPQSYANRSVVLLVTGSNVTHDILLRAIA